MASIQYVVNATGNLSTFLEKAGLTADHLDSQLADLSKRIATPEVDLKDTKFTLGMVNAAKRLDKLSAMVADPKIEVDSEKAQLEILRVNAMLDRLNHKHVTATVDVNVDRRGILGGLGGRLGGLFGGGAGAAAGGAPALAAGIPALGALGGTGGIAAILAGLAALPFAAVAAGGAMVTALGGGLTAIGLMAAAKNKQVKASFHDLGVSAGKDLQGISKPFQGVLESIAGTAKRDLPGIMKPLGDAFKTIAPPLKSIGNTFINSLASPVVGTAVRSLGQAFAGILTALKPEIPSMVGAIAKGINGIATAIRDHPQMFADFIKFLVQAAGFALAFVGALIRTADWIERFVKASVLWFKIWRDTVELHFLHVAISALKCVDTIIGGFAKLPGPLGAPFRKAKASIDATLHGMEVSAAQATARIQGSFNKLHNKHVTLDLFGSGKWAAHTRTEMGAGGLPLAASGMFVGGGSTATADDVLIRASRGELVVPARMVSAGMVDHLRGAIPGFASGGIIPRFGPARNAAGMPPWIAHNEAVTERQIVAGEGAAFAAAWKKFMDGSGAAIARYAMRFIGRIPYVWGGTAVPGGADCSGFTEAVYSRYGINAPRTSEAQGAWVRRGPPVPGGLAFYHSPPGGPDPGHVAIVGFGGQVISQGGGMGPQLMGLHSMPLLWTGTPPGGFGRLGGGAFGGSTPGAMSGAAIARLWTSLGGPGWAANNMARIAFAESGDRPGERQTGMPPGLTGWGLYQITPTSGITQNGRFGNLLNASNNTRAAIALFSNSGYAPWASDPVGRALLARSRGFDSGGWLPPGVSVAVNRTGRHERVLAPGEGGSVHVTVNVPPTVNPRAAGEQIAQLILAYTKSGGRLYPQGVNPR